MHLELSKYFTIVYKKINSCTVQSRIDTGYFTDRLNSRQHGKMSHINKCAVVKLVCKNNKSPLYLATGHCSPPPPHNYNHSNLRVFLSNLVNVSAFLSNDESVHPCGSSHMRDDNAVSFSVHLCKCDAKLRLFTSQCDRVRFTINAWDLDRDASLFEDLT